MSTLEAQLEAARTDLAAAETALAAILAGEDAAATTAKEYATWLSAKADAEVEVTRLRRLVAKLTSDVEAEAVTAAVAAQEKLETEANDAADKAAALIRTNLAAMSTLARDTMSAMAIADQKVAAAQRGRRTDLPALETVELRARRGEKLPRQIISQKELVAWSYESDKSGPINAELAARVSVGPGKTRGTVRTESGTHRLVLRRFRQTQVLPEVATHIPDPLASTLSIPPVRGGDTPGWSPIPYATSGTILQQIDSFAAAEAEPDRRRPETKIECLGDVQETEAAA